MKNTWDPGDVAMTLLVFNARQQAEIEIANREKIQLTSVRIPMSKIWRSDKEGSEQPRKHLGRKKKK